MESTRAGVGLLSRTGIHLLWSLLFVVTLSMLPWGCVTNGDPSYSENIAELEGPQGSNVSRSIFYSKEAEKQRRKAEQYLERATSHMEIQGIDSVLAVHYRQLAKQALESAEESARLSRFHRQLMEEEFEDLRQEMFPQP